MGYKLTSLVNLPLDERVDLYIFSIGGDVWEGGVAELIHRNFNSIAKEIGATAIIVGALEDSFHGEVVETYLGKHYKELKNLMPALLITDAHPRALNKESLRIIIPLREAYKRYEVIDDFLSDLASFARGEDDKLLKMLEDAPTPHEAADDIVEISIQVLPFVTVNLNGAVKNLRKWWNSCQRVKAMNLKQ